MSDSNTTSRYSDSVADAVAAIALILITVVTVVFWLSGQ